MQTVNPTNENLVDINDGSSEVNAQEQVLQNPELIPISLVGRITTEQWNYLTYEQRAILININKLPDKLLGIVPKSVWATLSLDQKIEFLYTHELLPSGSIGIAHTGFEGTDFEANLETMEGSQEGSQDLSEPVVEIAQPQTGEAGVDYHAEFNQAVSEVERIESMNDFDTTAEDVPPIPPVQPQELKQIQSVKSFDAPMPVFNGYQPSTNIVSELQKYMEGPANVGDTWVAHLANKVQQVLMSGRSDN